MRRHDHHRFLIVCAVLLIGLGGSSAAWAAQRTFVSAASGNDSNPCSRAFPCRNFGSAILQTDIGGEVVVLDSGGYGTVTVNRSISLHAATGVHAAITAFVGDDAIQVLDDLTAVVSLRGLYLNGLGGNEGITVSAAATVNVEDCVMSGFGSFGLRVDAPGSDVYVSRSVSRHNLVGFYFQSSGERIRATLQNIRAENNEGSGVVASSNSTVVVVNGIASGQEESGGVGFFTSSASSLLTLESCLTTFNDYGIYSVGTTRVSDTTIAGNSVGVSIQMPATGSILTFGNNRVGGNGTNGTFTGSVAQQ